MGYLEDKLSKKSADAADNAPATFRIGRTACVSGILDYFPRISILFQSHDLHVVAHSVAISILFEYVTFTWSAINRGGGHMAIVAELFSRLLFEPRTPVLEGHNFRYF